MRFLPSDEKFYDCFEAAVKKVVEGGVQLAELIEDFRDVPLRAQQIKDTEHEGDVVTHNTIEMLNRTFITPLDREDIHKLITSLDDVLDYIEACAARCISSRSARPPTKPDSSSASSSRRSRKSRRRFSSSGGSRAGIR